MEPMNLGSPPTSPATSPNVNPNFLPAFLIGTDAPQQNNAISPGRNKTPLTVKTSYINSDPRSLRQKLFNQSVNDSLNYTNQTLGQQPEKGGPPKQGLFDNTDGGRSQLPKPKTPIINSTMNADNTINYEAFSMLQNESYNASICGQAQPQIPVDLSKYDRIDTLWVTIFGFPPSATSLVLSQLANCGTITEKKQPTQGNWLHIKYMSLHDVSKALGLNGKLVSNCIMIGVVPYYNKDNKENFDRSFTSPIRARSLRMSYASPNVNTAVLPSQNVPQRSTGLVTKAMEYVFGW